MMLPAVPRSIVRFKPFGVFLLMLQSFMLEAQDAVQPFQCFDERPGTADRSHVTVTIARRSWLTNELAALVAEIVLREFLGYDVQHITTVSGQGWGPEITAGDSDMDLENWAASPTTAVYKEYIQERKEVLDAGVLGYAGRAGLFVFRSMLEQNRLSDYYKLFRNASAASLSGFLQVGESDLQGTLGENFPVCQVADFSWCGSGALEGYWAPPRCQGNPSSCIEVFNAVPAYDTAYFEQLVRNNGLEAVFGYYGWGMPDHLKTFQGQSRSPVFYWWQPDPLLMEVDAVRISFPDHYYGCDRNNNKNADTGDVACDYAETLLRKVVSRRVRENAPEGYYFLTKMQIFAAQIDAMMLEVINHPAEDAKERVACDFVKHNIQTFRTYAPACLTHPPDPPQDGDLVFNPDTLTCEGATIYETEDPTYCFPDGQRPGQVDRSDRTIKLVRRSWATHHMVSILAEALLRDYLGFNVELVLNTRTGGSFFGNEMVQEHYHVDVENWQTNPGTPNYIQFIETGLVLLAGPIGFSGRAGMYIRRDALDHNSMLDYYKIYANATDVFPSGIVSHADSPLREVVAAVGATFPVCSRLELDFCGTGALEGYWAPEKCRSNPNDCAELVHSIPFWDQGYNEQLIENNDLSLIVGYYGYDGAIKVLQDQVGTGVASPFYWWEPDTFVLSIDGVRISYPDFFYACDADNTRSPATGTTACDFPPTQLVKTVSTVIRNNMQEAYYVLERMEVFADEINMLLSGEGTFGERVCSFIHANNETLKAWAPDCLVRPLPPEQVRVNDTAFSPADLQCIPVTCPANQVLRYAAQFRSFYCDLCDPGEVPNADQSLCVKCPAGQEVNGDTGSCKVCQPGSSKPITGTVCEACGVGRYQAESGQSGCERCNSRSFQDEIGAIACKLCEETLAGGVSFGDAASAEDCRCRVDTYLPLNSTSCAPCPDGMICPEGADMRNLPPPGFLGGNSLDYPYPEVEEGYMTIADEPFKVYECLNALHCPGGAPGTCAKLRDASEVACGLCQPDTYSTDSKCEKCTGSDVIPILAAICMGLGACAAIVVAVNRNILMKTSTTMMCVILAGMMLTTLQTLTVFRQISIEWFEPFKSVFRALTVLSFDMELLRLSCVTGNGVVRSYVVRQLVAPIAVPILWIFLYIKRCFKPTTVVFNEFINTIGTVFNIFFISIVISAVAPFVCYQHPGDAGRSVVSNPSILCHFDGDHASIVAVGAITCLLVPIPFMTLMTIGILQYPRRVKSSIDSTWFLAAFRFLFMRFQPHAYWFGIIIALRGLVCCLIPVLIDTPAVQIVTMALVLCLFVLVQQATRPWRTDFANMIDVALALMLLMILLCLAVVSDFDGTNAVKVAAMAGLVLCLIIPGVTIIWAQRKKCIKEYYNAFICHHKADAAAQARLLKNILSAKMGGKVFIDSDDLIELDKLFDIVKTKVKLLLVYLTRDTLTRPWCVGEIATSFVCGNKVATVKTPSFVTPSEEEAMKLHEQIDSTGCNLQEQGIPVEQVIKGLVKVVSSSTPTVTINSDARGSKMFHDIAESVSHNRWDGNSERAKGFASFHALQTRALQGAVVCCADARDYEAVAAITILIKKIEVQVHSFVDAGIVNLVDHEEILKDFVAQIEVSRSTIFLLSRRTLDLLNHVIMITVGMSSTTQMIPVNLWDFKFPTPEYFEEILPEMWPEDFVIPFEEAKSKVRAFFKLITIFFATMSSDHVLDTQAKQVVARISSTDDGKKKASMSSTTIPQNGAGGPSHLSSSAKDLSIPRISEDSRLRNSKSMVELKKSSSMISEPRKKDEAPPLPPSMDRQELMDVCDLTWFEQV